MGDNMISLMIVDDHPMVREGLAAMLESEKDFLVSALAASGEEAVAIGRMSAPDVVLCDIRMSGFDGFETLARLKAERPDVKVLLFAGMPLKEEEQRAREEGARGYLPKSVDQDRLTGAIRAIAAGTKEFISERFDVAPSTLTPRELDVLRQVAQGKQRDAIAEALGIGSKSVKTHLKGIMGKLNCPNATSAVSRAYELGILRA